MINMLLQLNNVKLIHKPLLSQGSETLPWTWLWKSSVSREIYSNVYILLGSLIQYVLVIIIFMGGDNMKNYLLPNPMAMARFLHNFHCVNGVNGDHD